MNKASEISKTIIKNSLGLVSRNWNPYSRLILISDNNSWSLDNDKRETEKIIRSIGIKTLPYYWNYASSPQASLYFGSNFIHQDTKWLASKHRIGLTLPQGVPIKDEEKKEHKILQTISKYHHRIERIQVSHKEMRSFILESGIEPSKVFTIPIGVNLSLFRFRDERLRNQLRSRLGIPENAFLIGSFQKDGVGWGNGMEPKLVKGPDIFIRTVERLKQSIPNIFVLLIGPARGYVRAGLEKIGIPHVLVHRLPYHQLCQYYSALDLYIVGSRQEGGPKAVLESMAAGVPLVTTSVGQAKDLVQHNKNGWCVNIEDTEGLARWSTYVHENKNLLNPILESGLRTAQENSYQAQTSLWQQFMTGFVKWKE